MTKALPKDLMDLQTDARNTTKREQDSLSGELFSRLEMEDHHNLPSKTMHILWQDMLQSVKTTDSFQLLNQRSSLMEPTQLKNALNNQKESLEKS